MICSVIHARKNSVVVLDDSEAESGGVPKHEPPPKLRHPLNHHPTIIIHLDRPFTTKMSSDPFDSAL